MNCEHKSISHFFDTPATPAVISRKRITQTMSTHSQKTFLTGGHNNSLPVGGCFFHPLAVVSTSLPPPPAVQQQLSCYYECGKVHSFTHSVLCVASKQNTFHLYLNRNLHKYNDRNTTVIQTRAGPM